MIGKILRHRGQLCCTWSAAALAAAQRPKRENADGRVPPHPLFPYSPSVALSRNLLVHLGLLPWAQLSASHARVEYRLCM